MIACNHKRLLQRCPRQSSLLNYSYITLLTLYLSTNVFNYKKKSLLFLQIYNEFLWAVTNDKVFLALLGTTTVICINTKVQGYFCTCVCLFIIRLSFNNVFGRPNSFALPDLIWGQQTFLNTVHICFVTW